MEPNLVKKENFQTNKKREKKIGVVLVSLFFEILEGRMVGIQSFFRHDYTTTRNGFVPTTRESVAESSTFLSFPKTSRLGHP